VSILFSNAGNPATSVDKGLALGLWVAVVAFIVVWDARRHATEAHGQDDQPADDEPPEQASPEGVAVGTGTDPDVDPSRACDARPAD
jgi:hypothetical protein